MNPISQARWIKLILSAGFSGAGVKRGAYFGGSIPVNF
jgi:hypothetical protein